MREVERILAALDGIRAEVSDDDEIEDFIKVPIGAINNSGGAAADLTGPIVGPKQGEFWELTRISLAVSGIAAPGGVALFGSRDIDPQSLLASIPGNSFVAVNGNLYYSTSLQLPLVLANPTDLIIAVGQLPAGASFSGVLYLKRVRDLPKEKLNAIRA